MAVYYPGLHHQSRKVRFAQDFDLGVIDQATATTATVGINIIGLLRLSGEHRRAEEIRCGGLVKIGDDRAGASSTEEQ